MRQNIETKNSLKTIATLLCVAISIMLLIAPSSAITDVENGGTVIAGDEHYSFNFLDNSTCTTFGWWLIPRYDAFEPTRIVDLTKHDDVSFPISDYTGYHGNWKCVDPKTHVLSDSGESFILRVPQQIPTAEPTTQPTPFTTPSVGTISISSDPQDATVYVDNIIRGITPLTITVENGEHVVVVRLDGYQKSKTNVTVYGEDVSVDLLLIPVMTVAATIQTTVQTTLPTTIQTTAPTTDTTTEITTIPTTVAINYNDTIAAIQSQIDEQATKNAEQDMAITEHSKQIGFLQQLINDIMALIGFV